MDNSEFVFNKTGGMFLVTTHLCVVVCVWKCAKSKCQRINTIETTRQNNYVSYVYVCDAMSQDWIQEAGINANYENGWIFPILDQI
jgi:hypothetical protein